MFSLDIRLNKVCELIGNCDTLADIGSDHGYLPVYMLKTGRLNYALITDMNKGPLENAQRTADKYAVKDKCEFLLGDGLNCLKNAETPEVISICGMGGELIKMIIEENEYTARKSLLVLQPMNNPAILRKYLLQKGWTILSEAIVRDDYHFYQMFKAKFTGENCNETNLSEADYEYAPSLIEAKDNTMFEYLQYKRDVQKKIYENIKCNSTDNGDLVTKSKETLGAIEERIRKYEA